MERDAQRQSRLLRGLGPAVEDVALRADVLRVPGLVLRVPEVVVVVVVAQHEEVLCAAALVALHQRLGVPFLRLEQGQDVLEAHLRGVPIVAHMVPILARAFHIERACHPVAAALHALRSPVCPDAELCVAEPFGRLVRLQAFPRGLIASRLHRLVRALHGDAVGVLCRGGQGGAAQQTGYYSFFHIIWVFILLETITDRFNSVGKVTKSRAQNKGTCSFFCRDGVISPS